jgi:hypothetical protein
MPLNPFDANFRSFQNIVLPEVVNRGIAAIGEKSMNGGGEAIKAGLLSPDESLRYAMSLPVLTTLCGIDSYDVFQQDLMIAQSFKAMSEAELSALRTRVLPFSGDGRYELYKSSMLYDEAVGRATHKFPDATELPA